MNSSPASTSTLDELAKWTMFPHGNSDAAVDNASNSRAALDPKHPLFEYYMPENWGKAGSVATMSVLIAPNASVAVPGAYGMFMSAGSKVNGKYGGSVATAISSSTDGWRPIAVSDTEEEFLSKLKSFVGGVSLARCKDINGARMAIQHPESTADIFGAPGAQQSSGAYKQLLKANSGDASLAAAEFDGMRFSYAYGHIDDLFEEADDYFFVQRLLTLTKAMFVTQLLVLTDAGAAAGAAVPNQVQFDQVVACLYNNGLQYTVADPANKDAQTLDSMFRGNVDKSRAVKDRSDALLQSRGSLQAVNDNLQALANNDRLVIRQRRNSFIIYCVMALLVVLLVASLATSYYYQEVTVAYVIMVSVVILVLVIEATRTLTALVNF